MVEAFGGIVGGLGLFFVGMWLLSESLKRTASRRLREIAANWAPNRFAALGWGALAGGIIQSMPTLTFITVSLMRSNLVSTQRAFAFILGGNLGVGTLVLLVSLDVKLAALYVLGVASVLMVSERAIRLRNVGAVLFGVAMMYVGLGLVKESATALAIQPVLAEFSEFSSRSLLLTFFGAAVLSFAVQSSAAVAVFAISMGTLGILTNDQVYVSVFGSFAGTNITLLALSWTPTGGSRRIAIFEVCYNFLLVFAFVPILYAELWSGVPLMKSLVLAMPLDQPMALLGVMSDIIGVTILLLFLPLVVRLFARLWPGTAAEAMSRPEYIGDRSYGNVSIALGLIALEQQRVISSFSSYMDAVRRGGGIDTARDSVRTLIRDIEEFLTEVRLRHPGYSIEDVNSILTRQRLIVWLEEQFSELCDSLGQLTGGEAGERLRGVMVEGMDTVILTVSECLNSGSPDDWATANQVTSDRSEVLRQIRSDYMSQDSSLDMKNALPAKIVEVTNTSGEIFFLLSRLLREVEKSPMTFSSVKGNP